MSLADANLLPNAAPGAVHWTRAARALLSGCVDLSHADLRLDLLERICRGLGDALYPDFLTLLALIGECGDAQARAVLADTLLEGLRSGRVPSGRRQAWGAAGSSDTPTAGSSFGSWRTLGPIEYLCAAHEAGRASPHAAGSAPSNETFLRQGQSLLRLVDSSADARRLYVMRLQSMALDPVEGGLSRSVRHGLQAMAQAWTEGLAPDVVCQRYLNAMPQGMGQSLNLLAHRATAPSSISSALQDAYVFLHHPK